MYKESIYKHKKAGQLRTDQQFKLNTKHYLHLQPLRFKKLFLRTNQKLEQSSLCVAIYSLSGKEQV